MKRKTIISFIVLFVVSLGLIVGLNMLTINQRNLNKVAMYQDVYEEMFGKNVLAEAETLSAKLSFKSFFLGGEASDEIKAVLVIKEKNEITGRLYIVKGDNDFGHLELAVGIKNDSLFKIKVLSMAQTMDEQGSLDRIENLNLSADAYSGVTVTYTLLDKLLKVVFEHAEIDGTPPVVELREFEEYFGKEYVENTLEFETENENLEEVLEITNEELVVGYVFEIKGKGKYFDQENVNNDYITIRLITNAQGEILGATFPKDKYHHTYGFIERKVMPVINHFVGQNLKDLTTDDAHLEIDGLAGASAQTPGSGVLAYELIRELGESLENFDFKLLYSQWFDGKYEIVSDNTLVDDKILSVEKLVDENDELVGYVYKIKDEGYGDNDKPKASFELIIAVDKVGVIKGVDLPIDTYNHSKGSFYQITLDHANSLVGMNLFNLSNIDHVAGASNSPKLIDSMLLYLVDKVGGQND